MSRAISGGLELIGLINRYLRRLRETRDARAAAMNEYRLVTENVADVVFHERDGKIVWISPSVKDVLGAPPEYWIGRPSRDAVPPEDRPAAAARLAKVMAGEAVRERFRVISVDGVIHWADSRGKPFYGVDGRPDGFIVSLHLVDDEVAAQRALETAQALMRASADSMLDPQVLLEAVRDPAGRVVDFVYRGINRAACSAYGYEEGDLLGRCQRDTMPDTDGSGLMRLLTECLDVGEPLILDDFVFFSTFFNDEHRFDIRVNRAGVDLLSLTWRDVTERFRAAQRIAASERRYRLLAENAADIVCHVRDSEIVWVSPSVEGVMGDPPEAWVGRSVLDFVSPEDKLADPNAIAKAEVEGARDRIRVVAVDGIAHWFYLTAKPFYDDDGLQDGVVASLRLIDDEVAAEQEMQEARELLRASADSMRDPLVLMAPVRDSAGKVVDFSYRMANRAACAALGREERELIGSRLVDSGSVDRSGLMSRWVQCLEDGQPAVFDEFEFYSEILDESRRYEIRLARAGVDLLCVTWRDITERFQSAQRVAASERQYRLLAENAADVVAHIRDGRFVWISPSCEEVMGAPPEYWIGKSVLEKIPAEDAPIFAANQSTVMTGDTVRGRVRVLGVNDITHWAFLNAKPLYDDDGHQDGWTAAIRIIDDEVAAEQEAHEARLQRARADERYRRSIDNAAIGISVLTPDGRFVEVNDSLCQFYGYDAATLLGKTWHDLTAPGYLDADIEQSNAVLEGRLDSYRLVKQYIHADGHPIWGDLSVSCVRDENGQVENFVTQVADITAMVQADERNRFLAQELQRQRDLLAAELDSAAAYMASIMPAGLAGQVRVSSRYLPARALGGDCFHYTWIDDDYLLVYVIDVSGHGIEPALLSVSVHNLLRSGTIGTETLLSPEATLVELNRLFQMDRQGEHYFTIWYGVYQASTRSLRYASAGAPPAFAFNRGSAGSVSVVELSTAAAPVGMFEDTVFTSATYPVPPGCQILVFSDGASELDRADGQQLSVAGLKAMTVRLAAAPDWSLDTLIDDLRAMTPAGFFEDDCSLIQLNFG